MRSTPFSLLALLAWTNPRGLAYTSGLATTPAIEISFSPEGASVALVFVVQIAGRLLLLGRDLPGGQASLLERRHLLQQGFL
jgi:hypothetical protein